MGYRPEVRPGDHGRATLIERINDLRASSLPFAAPKRVLQTNEASLVRDVLQVLQGYPTSVLPWDLAGQCFYVRNGIHVLHLSQSSLYNILHAFACAATSLRRVEFFVRRIMKGTTESWLKPISHARPTLEAFVNVVHVRLESLRKVALEKELEAAAGRAGTNVTLLSLFANLSRVFEGAEFLEHVVMLAVPEPERLYTNDITPGQLATHILSSLYRELDTFCLLQDGQDDAYGTLLLLFVGCLWPTIASLDTWLREGILSDPAGELFFYEDKSVPIENSAFWENGYRFRDADLLSEQESKLQLTYHSPGSYKGTPNIAPLGNSRGLSKTSGSSISGDVPHGLVCPNFLQPLAKAILSAGKSLQLLQYVKRKHAEGNSQSSQVVCISFKAQGRKGSSDFDSGTSEVSKVYNSTGQEQVPLYDQFCASLRALLGEPEVEYSSEGGSIFVDPSYMYLCSELGIPSKNHLLHVLFEKERSGLCSPWLHGENKVNHPQGNIKKTNSVTCDVKTCSSGQTVQKISPAEMVLESNGRQLSTGNGRELVIKGFGTTFVVDSQSDVPHRRMQKDWLNFAQYCKLSALDDTQLQTAIFDTSNIDKGHIVNEASMALSSVVTLAQSHHEVAGVHAKSDDEDSGSEGPLCRATDFNYGLGCGKILLAHDRQTLTAFEKQLPNPTLLPSFQEQQNVSERLPSQSTNWNVVRMLEWIQSANLKATPALVVVQECLISSIQKQVDHVGQQLLAKLMGEWRLMEELALLRAIYLVGSGDLLQQFASVLFNKLDRGEPWDDFYELNTMLQESVRSSSHAMVLPALDSLVVTVLPHTAGKVERGSGSISSPPQIAGRAPAFGIDSLDSLFFTYKVAWPLELIIDNNAIRKYNQVMLFLLKVKRAKHALDKACRLTWKNGVGDAAIHKQRLLLQQKLMHFVNTVHQYIMDRVLYSAWEEFCESMSSAGSLDEVIACHDAYLVSIQRQCLVAPDKLWTLIAGRVKSILGLALNYYSLQRVLCDGVGASALNVRCQLEIERIERQFDECMVFLMRVLSFKLNVGDFPHLADLVTRINYNFYYMTEDGHLSTPIPESLGQTPRRTSRRV